MSKGKRWQVLNAASIPSEQDIAWAAGFIEGDGHIGRNGTTFEIDVTQKQKWPLEKLQILFGGSLGEIHNQGIKKATYWRYRVSGDRARSLANVIKSYMSPEKTEQIQKGVY